MNKKLGSNIQVMFFQDSADVRNTKCIPCIMPSGGPIAIGGRIGGGIPTGGLPIGVITIVRGKMSFNKVAFELTING